MLDYGFGARGRCVSNYEGGINTDILTKAIGSLNSCTWYGSPPGTMVFMSWHQDMAERSISLEIVPASFSHLVAFGKGEIFAVDWMSLRLIERTEN